jgi:hypothetical protein
MKIHLIKDANGKVVATFEQAKAGGAIIKPVLKSGHTVHEVEAAENYTADLKAFYQQHSR